MIVVVGKPLSIIYSECVFVAMVTQHAISMHHIIICGLSGYTIFVHIILQKKNFSKKKKLL